MKIDPNIVRKFRQAAPTYATYPAADRFVEAFDAPTLANWITAGNAFGMRDGVTLKIRFPMTSQPAFITKRDDSGGNLDWYPHHLEHEARIVSRLVSHDAVIDSMHWSGCTGTLPPARQAQLLEVLRENFPFAAIGAFSADVNPALSLPSSLAALRQAGVTRVEIGTPNLALLPADRTRSLERQTLTTTLVTAARQEGMTSIGADLIYGSPGQTLPAFEHSLEALQASEPDRITLRSCAPTSKTKSSQLAMLLLGADALQTAGYRCIGIDQFARPGDQLAIAHRQGRLTRLPYGYAPRPSSTVLALGPGAIGIAGPTYYQNQRNADDYCGALERGELPVMRGLQLSSDDMIRRAIIHSLMSNLFVDIEVIAGTHQVDFNAHFAAELQELATFEAAGLLHIGEGMITVEPAGYLMLGAICRVFDRYGDHFKQRGF